MGHAAFGRWCASMSEWRLATSTVRAAQPLWRRIDDCAAQMESQRGVFGRENFFGTRKMGSTNSTLLAAVLFPSATRNGDHGGAAAWHRLRWNERRSDGGGGDGDRGRDLAFGRSKLVE